MLHIYIYGISTNNKWKMPYMELWNWTFLWTTQLWTWIDSGHGPEFQVWKIEDTLRLEVTTGDRRPVSVETIVFDMANKHNYMENQRKSPCSMGKSTINVEGKKPGFKAPFDLALPDKFFKFGAPPAPISWSPGPRNDLNGWIAHGNVTSGWWFELLWKILVNWDDYSQHMGK